ncbi:MAG: HD domain-containing protein, partial [Campylobacterota bacterium]|nr:HD domain-containing protein [Campylobacterota bacterium]
KEIEKTQSEVIFKMGEIAELRSKETGNHVKRVASYCALLGKLYGLDVDKCNDLELASPMHDIGKVAIADSILNKPSKLNEDEMETMKEHTTLGYEMFKNSSRSILKAASIVSHEHHERYDGTGYPRGVAGEEIHIYGRIIAIADVFDALGSDRVYKKAWENDDIVKYFIEEKGKHFDPNLVSIFLENIDKFIEVQKKYDDKF